MKTTLRILLAVFLISTAASATKIPIPIEGATLNVSFQLQTQMLMNENGTPDGQNLSYDVFIRRSRLLVNGDLSQNFSYLIQLDNPNFGKNGNFTGRGYIQDAWFGWAPTGISGGTVFYVDAGLLLIPISHHLLESTTNFTTADVHTDSFRGISGATFPGLRDTGVQVRGWALDKKVGFRGGVYEGVRGTPGTFSSKDVYTNNPATNAVTLVPANPNAGLNPRSNPQFAGFVNFDLIGSEEGGWLYGANKWGKDMILSVGLSGLYQAQALRGPVGITDQKLASADVYLNMPMGGEGESELTVEATGYLNGNGTDSANTGIGGFIDVGYRHGMIEPYVSFDYFSATSCDTSIDPVATGIKCGIGVAGTAGNADSRNFRVGLNYFVNKNFNHVNLEFSLNRGQSTYGTQSVAPAVPVAAGDLPLNSLARPPSKSLLLHWNMIF